ncbi:hypothetical protein L21SP2_1500 [Salinispira pacifica]|uniref:Uncharacterized protein n=1 Tax=Salinispira pacifica TaxID=1307761 RepID=V5WGD3_9SPIO|nr:hypothetical protein L21SP2_1500 [Salinispira pacifica]
MFYNAIIIIHQKDMCFSHSTSPNYKDTVPQVLYQITQDFKC